MKKFELSNDKILCGVCGGIANYFKIDVTLVRAIMIVFNSLETTYYYIYNSCNYCPKKRYKMNL